MKTRKVLPVQVGLEGLALHQSNAQVILHYSESYFGIAIEHPDWYMTADKDIITWSLNSKQYAPFVVSVLERYGIPKKPEDITMDGYVLRL